jgi:hypothetical protein
METLASGLSDRDWSILNTLSALRVMSGSQIIRLFFGTSPNMERAGRRALLRLTRSGFLERLQRRVGGVRAGSRSHTYRLGGAGHRLLGTPRKSLEEPGLAHLAHNLELSELYVRLQTQAEDELQVLGFQPEPDCWRRFLGAHGEPVILKPDGFAQARVAGRTRLWFIEIDRGTLSSQTIRTKLKVYRDYLNTGIEQEQHSGVFPRVVWRTITTKRAAQLHKLLKTENSSLGAELHRLIEDEWPPGSALRAPP